jgi:YHS domain-containing protein
VAILRRIIQFLLWFVVAAWVVRKALVWLFGGKPQSEPRPDLSGSPRSARPLYRDPVCGTYVAPEISQTFELAGQVHHFCSAECRERFRSAQQLKASA